MVMYRTVIAMIRFMSKPSVLDVVLAIWWELENIGMSVVAGASTLRILLFL